MGGRSFRGLAGLGPIKRECEGAGTGEADRSVRGHYNASKGINMTVLEKIQQLIL